jgi:hypothetical protein
LRRYNLACTESCTEGGTEMRFQDEFVCFSESA